MELLKCDHIKRLLTLTIDYIKWILLLLSLICFILHLKTHRFNQSNYRTDPKIFPLLLRLSLNSWYDSCSTQMFTCQTWNWSKLHTRSHYFTSYILSRTLSSESLNWIRQFSCNILRHLLQPNQLIFSGLSSIPWWVSTPNVVVSVSSVEF